MKKIIILIASLFTFSSCTDRTDEDSYYQKSIYLNTSNFIKVYTQPSFSVGDKLYIASIFSKLQDEPGFLNKLDIFKTTNTRQFGFYFSLEKRVFNGNWTVINLQDSDFETGGLGTYGYGNAICNLDLNNENYEFYKGLILQEAGEYRLTIYPNIEGFYGFNSYYGSNNIAVRISTTIENLTGNTYEFAVN